MKTFKQFLTEAKLTSKNELPAVYKTAKDVIKAYPTSTQKAMDDMLREFGSALKDEYRESLTLEKYVSDWMNELYPTTIDYNDQSIKDFALENKDKIVNRLKRSGFKGEELDLLFWREFKYFYNDYKNKLESMERKKREAEEKAKRQAEREAKKAAKTSFQSIKGIFDKGPKDLVWKSLLKLKDENKKYYINIKKEYDKLKESDQYYIEELDRMKYSNNKQARNLNLNYKARYLNATKRYSLTDIALALSSNSVIEKVLNDDIEYKYADLIKRVYSKIGTNIENVELRNSSALSKDGREIMVTLVSTLTGSDLGIVVTATPVSVMLTLAALLPSRSDSSGVVPNHVLPRVPSGNRTKVSAGTYRVAVPASLVYSLV